MIATFIRAGVIAAVALSCGSASANDAAGAADDLFSCDPNFSTVPNCWGLARPWCGYRDRQAPLYCANHKDKCFRPATEVEKAQQEYRERRKNQDR